MKFDVVIGNPPYQVSDGGGTGDSAKPVYNDFIDVAKSMKPNVLSMICPSRWMKGGKGLDEFRNRMMEDTHLKSIHDFANPADFFPAVHIDGGVNYFLWSKTYKGKCHFYHKGLDGYKDETFRFLKNGIIDTVIRDSRQISIIEKALSQNEEKFSQIVSSRKPYGIATDLFNCPEKYKDLDLIYIPKEGYLKIYGVKGNKGGAKRMIGYIKKTSLKTGLSSILKYKLFFSYAYSTGATVPPEIIVGKPYEIATETFLQIGNFDTEKECRNCLQYVKTKFFRALLYFNRIQKNASNKTFAIMPIQNFNESWTDEKLYKKYGLTREEIDFIESMIKPME